jgi:ribosomal protein S27E
VILLPIIPRETNKDTNMSVLQNLKGPVRLQCKRCGREWVYHGKNPYRARCTYCGTTVMVESSRVDR